MFTALSDKFEGALRKLSGQGKISEANVRGAMDEVREALLEADVHYEVAQTFCDKVVAQALGTQVLDALKPAQQMIQIVHDQLVALLAGDELEEELESQGQRPPFYYVEPGPTVVMMCGLQGSGKTTTCGKLAGYLKRNGKTVMLAAADLQRPAAVAQLEVVANQVRDAGTGGGEGPGEGGAWRFTASPIRSPSTAKRWARRSRSVATR